MSFANPRFPRSNTYATAWVVENQMGPNALWLMEWLTQALPVEAGMRVLDLGCGKAISSIFLAREFGAQVWAADLWIAAGDNLKRIREAELLDRVSPIHAEAHDLPFGDGFFDAIVSVDAYQYFGTADLYLGYISRFLRKEGRIGIVVPAVSEELGERPPAHLEPYWDWEFCCFHGPEWWRRHWSKTGKVRVETADALADGWKDWLAWEEYQAPHTEGFMREMGEGNAAMLRADAGKLLGFARVVGAKT